MSERLAFNLWGVRPDAARIASTGSRRPSPAALPDAAATVPAADREAELGLLGRLCVHGAALLPAAGHGARRWRRCTCRSSSRSARSSRWSGTGSAAAAGGAHLARNHRRRPHGARDARDGAVLGLARRRARDVHRRLFQSRAGVPPDGQQRPQRQGAAMAHVADSLRHGLRRARAASSTLPAAPT